MLGGFSDTPQNMRDARRMSVRRYEMLKRFPAGSFARIKMAVARRGGHLVQIIDALDGMPMQMKVLVKPLKKKRRHKNHLRVLFRNLEPVTPLEVLAEAGR
jgi:hypothetical protein